MANANDNPLTYSTSGGDYSSIDPAKVSAQAAAAKTAHNLNAFNMTEVTASRGESAYVWREGDAHRALVVEGLGTKNLVADAMRAIGGKTYYEQIAQDTVAMIVNDLIVVGALPNVVNAYFAIGDSAWMNEQERTGDLIRGWAAACDLSGATWGGGETPALKGIINPETIDLAGSAIGSIAPGQLVLGDELAEGDAIILIESSGIHANGLTLARSIADQQPDGYATTLPDGRMYGDALLTPTHIYVSLVRELLQKNVDIHYMVNITGHGWRKLMRATKDFTYTMNFIPEVPAELTFIKEQAHIDDTEMYGNFNMGAGFAIYVPQSEVPAVLKAAKQVNLKAWHAGTVTAGPKKVIIEPANITFDGASLGVR
ncbi:MAG: AIR synthase-related protein [Candidatus Saccharimonadales bacterium]